MKSTVPGRRPVPLVKIKIPMIGETRNDGGFLPDVPSTVYIALFPTGPIERPNPTCMGSCQECAEMSVLTRVSPNYQHCQILFCWNAGGGTNYFTTFDTRKAIPSEFVKSCYTRPGWRSYALLVDSKARAAMYDKCHEIRGSDFNGKAFYWNFLQCVPSCCTFQGNGREFFCAQQVAIVLQAAKIPAFSDIVPHLCTPDEIHERLEQMVSSTTALTASLDVAFWNSRDSDASGSTMSTRSSSQESPQPAEMIPILGPDEPGCSNYTYVSESPREKVAQWNQFGATLYKTNPIQ